MAEGTRMTKPDIEEAIKKELKRSIIDQVEKTFSIMFNVKVQSIDNIYVSFNDDDMVAKVEMHQNDVDVVLRFIFPRPLLKPLLLKIYPPAMATHEVAYEDAACEIANIVCNGVKTFLNQNGYKLLMQIPKIDYSHVSKSSGHGDSGHLNVNFILQDDGFAVDLVMDDKTKHSQKNQKAPV